MTDHWEFTADGWEDYVNEIEWRARAMHEQHMQPSPPWDELPAGIQEYCRAVAVDSIRWVDMMMRRQRDRGWFL